MPSITKKKLSYNNAKIWRNSVYNSGTTDPVLYIFIGNNVPYANESSPDSLVDTISTEKDVWNNIYAAKKVTANDVELVIPKVTWSANSKYRNYDDTIDINTLLSSNTAQGLSPMYVITTGRNVYKCMSNNSSANSTIEPSGDYTTSNGNIATADGYLWKYMYNVKPSNKFLTTDWIPTPTSTSQLDYNVNDTGVVDGELTRIIVTANGTNYREASNIVVASYTSGQTTFQFANTARVLSVFQISTVANLANMSVSGTGIPAGSYITATANATGVITLSAASTTSGGGNTGNLTISTRVYVDGDGTGVAASATLSNTTSGVSSANANISKVTITTIGTGYSRANAFIYGSGTGAAARVIVSPKYGHAYNPASELNASNLMFALRIGEIDTTENGLISSNTSFRQYGLLSNPHKYANTSAVTQTTANSVISQTTGLGLVAGGSYTLDEFVYQGTSSSTATFYGYVNSQTSNEVKLSKVIGTVTIGLPLVGLSSGVSRIIITKTNPEFKPYTGDILYVENITKTQREDGQAENIKLVVRF
jgi:hypothetical protein